MMLPEVVGDKMEPERLFDAVNILFSLQVRISFTSIVSSLWISSISLCPYQ